MVTIRTWYLNGGLMAELQLFKQEDLKHMPERIIVYGRSGIGKSRFGLMLPETDKWGEILYYAADDNSEALGSIRASARKRIHIIKPRGRDHLRNFQQFCFQDWKKLPSKEGGVLPEEKQPYLGVKTLVVDTFSTVTYKVIQQIANEGSIAREEHYRVGDPNEGGQVIPSRSDYQGSEAVMRGFIDTLFDKQREYNVIFLCHEESKEVTKGIFAGGPAVPGRRMLEDLPGSFNTVIRLIREPLLVPGDSVPTMKVIAVTDNDGRYIAKLREGDYDNGNILGRIPLDKNPINFWERFDAFMSSESR